MHEIRIEGFQLSPQQKRLWLLQQHAQTAPFHAWGVVRIAGDLDSTALQRAIDDTIGRYEILRTTFQCPPAMAVPLQVIGEVVSGRIQTLDFSSLAPEDQTSRVEATIHELLRSPIDLERGPLLRALLAALGPQLYLLFLCLPALCADAATIRQLVVEIGRAYGAALDGAPLDDEPLQYVDIAQWQNEQLASDEAEVGRAYWREQSQASPAALDLPIERQSGAPTAFEPQSLGWPLDRSVGAQLAAFVEQHATSADVALLACWQALLWRLSEQPDIAVGVAAEGRSYEGLEDAIGLFAKYVPIRAHLTSATSFATLARQVNESLREAYEWQECFTWKQDETGLGSDADAAFFPACFDFAIAPTPITARNVTLTLQTCDAYIDRFKVRLSCLREDTAFATSIHYSATLFDSQEIERLLARLHTLAASALANPHAPIAMLDILGAAERQQLLVEFNNTQVDLPASLSIHQRFEEQAERAPDAIAVVFEVQRLSYAALNARADQLARHLRRLGVGPDGLVAVCIERSLELLVGILGILKAGSAYVPLDPHLPAERLAYMLEDSRASVLLTATHGSPQDTVGSDIRNINPPTLRSVVDLTKDWQVIVQAPAAAPQSGLASANLVYLLYTSGSTGKPKGVAVEHAQLLNYLDSIVERLDLPAGASFATVSTFGADLGHTTVFPSLCTGGCLHIVSQERITDPGALAEYFRRDPIDCLKIVPSHLAALILAAHAEDLLPRKRLALGGEAARWQEIAQIQALAPNCRIFNHYGPTETTVGVLTYQIEPNQIADLSLSPPLGRPLANSRIYLLDRYGRLAPLGMPGEIYIGGAGVARGYAQRLDLTAERFVPDAWSGQAGARLYRTGDLGRYREDGAVEFLGRIDDQVKIRGYRIELGEIEAVLERHPAVQEAVVLAREYALGDRRLVAYLVPRQRAEAPARADHEADLPTNEGQGDVASRKWSGANRLIDDVRRFLSTRLPDYMLPAAFVALPALPLTRNGKIDRLALPAPDQTRPVSEKAFVEPRTPTEQALAAIWKEVLRAERVGIHDNFFALGGDSILSIQVIARAQRIGLRFTPMQFFQYQTIAELLTVADTTGPIDAEQQIVTGQLPLTPIQHWFFQHTRRTPEHGTQSLLLDARRPLDPAALASVVQRVLAHHDALHLRFVQTEGAWRQQNAEPDRPAPFAIVDLVALPEQDQSPATEAIVDAVQTSLDMVDGPMARIVLFTYGSRRPDLLLISCHRLVIDGVSWRILLEDLQLAYSQLERGAPIQLAPKTTSFKQWAERLADYAQSELLRQEAAYWIAALSTPVARLPVDRADDQRADGRRTTSSVSMLFDTEETRALLYDVPYAYRTQINDVLLTALTRTLADWTNSSSLLLSLEGHGREPLFDDVDLSRTVGWFSNVFPIAVEYDMAAGPGEALKAVKEQLRCIPNRGMGYGLLRTVNTDPAISAQMRALPQQQINFNYLGQFDQVVSETALFGPTTHAGDAVRSRGLPWVYLLEIVGNIVAGRLQMNWRYDEGSYQRTTVEGLAKAFAANLRDLIAHCQEPGVGGYTPSDFPRARVSQADLDSIVAQIDARTPRSRSDEHDLIEDIYELAPMQAGMLFHTLYDTSSAIYFQELTCRIRSSLDLAAFERAWRYVLQRHSVLRTSFHWEGRDKPLQVVHREAPLPLVQLDWRMDTEAEQQARFERYLIADRVRGFQLSVPPAFRVTLIRIANDQHYLIWSHHHIQLDGWSVAVLLREVFALYDAFHEERTIDLGPVYPYSGYIEWLQRQSVAATEHFWRTTLQGFTAPTTLAVESGAPRGVADMAEYAEQRRTLAPATTTALQALARQWQITPNTFVQGAWALLLSRYSNSDDVLFGATVSGRPPTLPGIEEMIGPLLNTMPVRAPAAGQMSLQAWLKQLHARQVELQNYAHTPLVQIQGWSDVPRGTPLFESLVVFENYPVDDALLQGRTSLEIDEVRVFERTNYPLTLVASLRSEELSLRIGYEAPRFDADTIERLLGHLHTVLESFATEPEARASAISILTPSERAQILVDWNATAADYPDDTPITALIEAQAARTPDAIAVVFQQRHLSYAALERKANQLGRYLRTLGVGPEVSVGVYMERSPELIIGLLGILKAGGAYVPLDLGYPLERIRFMAEDSQAPIILTTNDEQLVLSEAKQRTTNGGGDDAFGPGPWSFVNLSADWLLIAQSCDAPLPRSVGAEHVAYVLYTSGSTGTPKGVMATHRGLVNYLLWATRRYMHAEGRGAPLHSAIGFDLTVTSLFAPLLVGQRVELLPESIAGEALGVALAATPDFSLVKITPAHLDGLTPSIAAEQAAKSARTLVIGGEALRSEQLAFWHRYAPTTRLFNEYGPTETVVGCCVYEAPEGPLELGNVPIGRPIANTQIYVLDRRMTPVPIGVVGELYIGGVQLARGYLRKPDLTAAAFVPNPFGTMNDEDRTMNKPHSAFIVQRSSFGARLYKTGDLVRYRPDGMIEYLGRIDQQVKLRGYRIELGEIETALIAHPAIREAVVLLREDIPGDARLATYVVPVGATNDARCLEGAQTKADENPSSFVLRPSSLAAELRAFLAARLPEYMIPSAFVILDTMPLTPNGKVDRRGLPVPEQPAVAATIVAPRDQLEFQLVQLWEEVLNVGPIGVKDSFFALGGHSLLALRVMARLQALTGAALPLATLFRNPTIEQLACVLRNQAAPSTSPVLITITPGDRPPLFCIHPLGGNVLCYVQLARHLGSAQPVYGIQSPGLERDQALPISVEGMAAEYVEVIRAAQPTGPYMLGGWSVGGVIALEIAQQLTAQGEPIALLALLDSYAPQPAGAWEPDDAELLVGMAQQLSVMLDLAVLRSFEAEGQCAYVLEQAQRSAALLPELSLAQFQRLFAVYKANAKALVRYAPRSYDGRATLFRAEEAQQGRNPAPGWEMLAKGGVELCDVPGAHETMLREPQVCVLAERLRAAIARAQEQSSLSSVSAPSRLSP